MDNSEDIITDETEEIEAELKESSNMTFFEHIEELRKRLVISIVAVVISCIIVAFFISDLMRNIFIKPALDANLALQNLQPFGQPFLYFKVIAASGIILAIPVILYQFWLFILPALYQKERKWVSLAVLFTSLCFLAGVVFSYFILIPTMLKFAAQFGSDLIENKIDINAYFSFIAMILLATGALFELPMLSFALSKIGVINHKFLSKYRRHAIIIILVLAAVLTPTPDPISQLIFAAPIFILYEISIFIAWAVNKNKKTEQN